ncbi:MAG: DUF4139 domain-containing protein [Planctomycetes bacterium]|nr:DUF4139 domain-containing protein [Planctomycetota bacterium]
MIELLLAACLAADAPADGVSLTVYSTADAASFDPQTWIAQQRQGYNPTAAYEVPGFGVIREIRGVDMPQGAGSLAFTDVAAFIDPTTVAFEDLTDPATVVTNQRFEFDLVSPEKLLEKYIDHPISAMVDMNTAPMNVEGTLLAARNGQLVVQSASGGVQLVNQANASITLGALPGGLRTRPTLLWDVISASAGSHKIRTSYQTSGITWRADYNLILDPTDTKADMTAWVTMLNVSGRAYDKAQLKLIAGDVQRVQPGFRRGGRAPMPMAAAKNMEASDTGFQEKAFFEFHLYTLPRPANIPENSSEQISLFPAARNIPIERILVYEGSDMGGFGGGMVDDPGFGATGKTKVDVYVRFKNEAAANLGMPLPAGKLRVSKRDDSDGTLEFIGEDLIGHTPKDEKVLVRLGSAFDVVGSRTQTDFKSDRGRREITESFKIEIRNRKDKPVTVIVREPLYRWSNWEVTASSQPFEKKNASNIEFTLDVPANSEKLITYTVRYRW